MFMTSIDRQLSISIILHTALVSRIRQVLQQEYITELFDMKIITFLSSLSSATS